MFASHVHVGIKLRFFFDSKLSRSRRCDDGEEQKALGEVLREWEGKTYHEFVQSLPAL